MKRFMQYDFDVKEIVLCCFLPKGIGDNIHRNRASHGLALMIGGEKLYTFDNGRTITVRDGDMIYLPKGSNYTVLSLQPGECYAINFNVSEEISFSPFSVHIKNSRDMVSAFQHAERNWRTKKQGCLSLLFVSFCEIICVVWQVPAREPSVRVSPPLP